jgi:hypothetical protein
MRRTVVAILFGMALAACQTPPLWPSPSDDEGWHAVAIPGKRATQYARGVKGGLPAISASADRSASLWRRHLRVEPDRLGSVQFSWWVEAPLAGADLATPGRGDAPARVLFSFAGDHAALSPRNRLLFDLAETLSGERPPFATLMYVYGHDGAAPGQVLVHPRTDRVREIVLDAGPEAAGRWRVHRRDLVADYRRAFGEAPGALLSVAVMTDADDTQQQARAWYGPIQLNP